MDFSSPQIMWVVSWLPQGLYASFWGLSSKKNWTWFYRKGVETPISQGLEKSKNTNKKGREMFLTSNIVVDLEKAQYEFQDPLDGYQEVSLTHAFDAGTSLPVL